MAVPDVRWELGLEEEIEFWARWLHDRGAPWSDDYVFRNDPESPLQPAVTAQLDPGATEVRLLDVGSGPLTILGKRWGDRRVEITAVDPLADRYAELFARFGLVPLVTPVLGQAERLSDVFPRDSFDLAFARNCLDHGYAPLDSIRQMLQVVKPGGIVLLHHATDEGEFMSYAGPHQWNFRIEDGRFVIWSPGQRVDAHALLELEADIETAVATDDSRYMSVALRKR